MGDTWVGERPSVPRLIPYAGMIRIRFQELAFEASQPGLIPGTSMSMRRHIPTRARVQEAAFGEQPFGGRLAASAQLPPASRIIFQTVEGMAGMSTAPMPYSLLSAW